MITDRHMRVSERRSVLLFRGTLWMDRGATHRQLSEIKVLMSVSRIFRVQGRSGFGICYLSRQL